MKKKYNILCIIGFILSIFIPPIGLFISYIGKNNAISNHENGKNLARIGIFIGSILSIILVILIILFFIGVVLNSKNNNDPYLCNKVYECDNENIDGYNKCYYCSNTSCDKILTVMCPIGTDVPFNYHGNDEVDDDINVFDNE